MNQQILLVMECMDAYDELKDELCGKESRKINNAMENALDELGVDRTTLNDIANAKAQLRKTIQYRRAMREIVEGSATAVFGTVIAIICQVTLDQEFYGVMLSIVFIFLTLWILYQMALSYGWLLFKTSDEKLKYLVEAYGRADA